MANKAISTLAVGSIIKLNESGSPVEFYVCKHDYESALNGSGRTLVVRKDCYDNRQWHSSNVNAYASSDIDSWLNGPYKNLLDADIRGVIGTTKIKYTPGNGNNTVGTLERAIFQLSATELNRSASWFNVEGTALEIASSLQIAYMNGSVVVQWTRSPGTDATDTVICLRADGFFGGSYCTDTGGSRPAFTLPSTTLVDDSGNVVTVDLTAHKTLVGGTAYTVKGGKCLVNGTVYNILKGRTLINGTGYDINFEPPFPRKGDLITMNLDGTDRLYRVLKIVDGTTVEVFRVQNLNEMVGYSGSAEYAGNNIDVALNQTYYNTLTTAAKNAIVAKDINQYSYASSNQWASGRPSTFYYPANKWLRYHVGDRFVYALDLEDVEEYFDSKYTSNDLNTVFFQDYIGTSSDKKLWLRSMNTNHDDYAASIIYGTYAVITGTPYYGQYGVQPAFQIDLSKIDFTIN